MVHIFGHDRNSNVIVFGGAFNHLLQPMSLFRNVVDDGYLLYKLVAPKLPSNEFACDIPPVGEAVIIGNDV